MGEKQNQPSQLSFNASLKMGLQGSRVTSDGGPILVRELDERLGLGELIAEYLTDSRRGKTTQLPLCKLLGCSPSTAASRAMRTSTMPRALLVRSDVPTDRFREDWERGAVLTSRLNHSRPTC